MTELEFGHMPAPAHGWGTPDITEARWERVRESVDITELVQDLFGVRIGRGRTAISCPLGHGVGATDSRPSFYVYPESNSCYCFGCPPGDNYFDPVGLTAKVLEISKPKALSWLEKNYDLPHMEEAEPEPDMGPEWLVGVEDLKLPYVKQVRGRMQAKPSGATARAYLRIYWEAQRDGDPVRMAQVVGRDTIEQLLRRTSIVRG